MKRSFTIHRVLTAVALLVLAATLSLRARQNPAPPAGLSPAIDVIVTDAGGAAVDTLGPADFSVAVNGEPRAVAAVRFVTRGPGALHDTATLQAARGTPERFAAEPARTVFVVIDQTTLVRGDEKSATTAARGVIDRLGLDDRIAIVPLPLAGSPIALDTDRPALAASLREVVGQRSVASLSSPDPFARSDRPVELGGERAGSGSAAANAPVGALPSTAGGDSTRGGAARSNVADLRALFQSLGSTPGRKTVILFSGGLTGAGKEASVGVDEAAMAAARSHVVLHAFGLKASALAGELPDARALDALARGTGGRFTPLTRNPDQLIGRALADLSSCYVLTLAGAPPAGVPLRLTVATARPGLQVRAPGWLAARPDASDVTPLPQSSAPAEDAPPPGPVVASDERSREAAMSEETRAELRRILARVADYIDTYQREYSSVVAEEEYDQSDWSSNSATKRLRLRSDFLLVRPDPEVGWVSFRDVFEVDGNPVRERDARLQRLFLDNGVRGLARLRAVEEESARFNLGPFKRATNAPLFPLRFLERQNQRRFAIVLKGTKTVNGLPVAELDYHERVSPTFAGSIEHGDQPASGRFLVDTVSGAIVEARVLYEREGAGRLEYTVQYRRDDTLGLWLPDEMRESFNPKNKIATLGVAHYRNFRRFQVTTDTKVGIPK